MIAVISDLHFEEEATDCIGKIGLPRNVPARAFEKVFKALAGVAEQNNAQSVELVLAGDVFDLHRTSLWVWDSKGHERPKNDQARPYVSNQFVADEAAGAGSGMKGAPGQAAVTTESRIQEVLAAISNEPEVGATLQLLRAIAGRRLAGDPAIPNPFKKPVSIEFLPGNHDRLLNSTETIRGRVRELLGMAPSTAPFPHVIPKDDPGVLIRHGHEYDRYNFSEDYEGFRPFPTNIPEAHYGNPTFGDFITLEVAAALPRLFRDEHTDKCIAAKPELQQIYKRLLEFDDVRPQSALMEFLLHIPDGPSEETVWRALEPVVKALIDRIYDHQYLQEWLHKLGYGWIALALKSPLVRGRLTLGVLKDHFARIASGKSTAPEVMASHEVFKRFVIAGHTHEPQVAVIGPSDSYYIDTGTWRHRVLCSDNHTGRLKALTYVTVYGSGEDRGKPPVAKTESFDFWSGYTQRWEA